MKEALAEAQLNLDTANHAMLDQLKIYVAQDCTIYKQDVIDLCTSNTNNNRNKDSTITLDGENLSKGAFKPCILLISVRLGGEELNEIYVPSLKLFLEMDICIGMIGGKPKHSLYFIGYQGIS
jgi:cysteine protease ATG4